MFFLYNQIPKCTREKNGQNFFVHNVKNASHPHSSNYRILPIHQGWTVFEASGYLPLSSTSTCLGFLTGGSWATRLQQASWSSRVPDTARDTQCACTNFFLSKGTYLSSDFQRLSGKLKNVRRLMNRYMYNLPNTAVSVIFARCFKFNKHLGKFSVITRKVIHRSSSTPSLPSNPHNPQPTASRLSPVLWNDFCLDD